MIVNISIQAAEKLKIKQRREDEFRGFCSVCQCNDSHYNTSKMVWNCLHCHAKGRILSENGYVIRVEEEKPAPVFDIPNIRKVYNSLTNKFCSSLTSQAIDYMKNRGLTEDTISKFKLGFCSSDYYEEYSNEKAEESGVIYQNYPLLANHITIPYIVNNEVTDIRGRIVPFCQYRNNTPTYTSLAGSYESRGANFLYNHDIISKSSTIILTEGEFKAILAIQYGFPVVATPGIFRWIKQWSDLLKDKEVILAADSERKTGQRPPLYLQAKILSKELPKLKIAILGFRGWEDSKDKKMDIDSLILKHGVKSFESTLKGAIDVNIYLHQEERKGYVSKNK